MARIDGGTHINILPSIVVNVYYGHATAPFTIAIYIGDGGYILEFQVFLVEVQLAGDLVTGKIYIREAVVIKIANPHPCAIVHVRFVERVDRIVFSDPVVKLNVRLVGGNKPEQRIVSAGDTGNYQAGNEYNK